jgi:uncharacterized Zn ribbon protein
MKAPRLQPATKDKTCQICGSEYTYPEKGSNATRFHCDQCADLPPAQKKILTKMAKRITALERKFKP